MDDLAAGVFGFVGLLALGLLVQAAWETQSGLAREQRKVPLMTAECAEKGGVLVRNWRDFNIGHPAYLSMQYQCTLPDGSQADLVAGRGE
jgi:hypothetical protein